MSSKTKKKVTSPQSKNSGNKNAQPSTALAAEAQSIVSIVAARQTQLALVIERLRISQAEHDEQLLALGSVDGTAWARNKATTPELRRLERARDPSQDWYFGVGSSAYSDAERFFFIIRPGFDGDRAFASEFWEIVTGDTETPETGYVQAFAEGAMAFWNEVKDQI